MIVQSSPDRSPPRSEPPDHRMLRRGGPAAMERLARNPLLDRPARLRGTAAGGVVVILAGLYAGWLASQGSSNREATALLLLGVAVVALAVSPNVFLGLSVLTIGTDSLSEAHPLAFGGTQVYSLDVLLGVVLLRAFLPRERAPKRARLGDLTVVLFAIWAAVMIVAAARPALSGYALVPIVRLSTPLLYSVGLYIGFGRVIRERGFDLDTAMRYMLTVALGLVAYMALARVANTPFEDETNPAIGHLGTVVTTGGELRRDYGLASAFIVYPVIALAAAAYLLHGSRRAAFASAMFVVGVVATLLTLIRGEIFGLVIGLAAIAVVRTPTSVVRTSRPAAIASAAVALLIAGLGLWVASPSTARGVAERSLPGVVKQSTSANQTAKYRHDAVDKGFEVLGPHPAGVGLVPEKDLTQKSGVDLGYVAHSGLTAMAVYAGWFGLIASVLALLGLLRDSFLRPRPNPWLHPLLVG